MRALEIMSGNSHSTLTRAVAKLFRAHRSHATQETRVLLGHPEVGKPLVKSSRERPKRSGVAAEVVVIMESEQIREPEPHAEAAIPWEEIIARADRQPPD
jgi:hypothetical protein